MTVAFVLHLLIPLLIIFLCFSSFTKERETQTLPLLLSQGVSMRQLFWGKVAGYGRALGWLVIPALLLGAGLLFAQTGFQPTADTLARLALFELIYVVYFGLVIVGSVYVSARAAISRSGSSRTSLLALLGVWLLAGVILPRASANLGKSLFAVPSSFAFQQQIHDEVKGIDGHNPQSDRAKALEKRILAQYGADSVSKLPVNFDGIVMQEGEKYTSLVYQKHFSALQAQFGRQNSLATWAGFVNPFLAVRSLSMGLAGTDYAHFVHFKTYAEPYRFGLIEKLNGHMTTFSKTGDWEKTVDPTFWQQLPDFQYKSPTVGWVLAQHGLSVVALLFFGLGLVVLVNRALL